MNSLASAHRILIWLYRSRPHLRYKLTGRFCCADHDKKSNKRGPEENK